jgi:hypothetical protein
MVECDMVVERQLHPPTGSTSLSQGYDYDDMDIGTISPGFDSLTGRLGNLVGKNAGCFQ